MQERSNRTNSEETKPRIIKTNTQKLIIIIMIIIKDYCAVLAAAG